MDEQAKAEAIAVIASRHVESLQRDLRQDIALRLLAENGQVSTRDVDERFAAEWIAPDPRMLANVVAAKAAAAVEFHRREVQWETDAVDRARDKLVKVEEKQAALVASARADAEAAESSSAPAEARQRLRDAEELAAYARGIGDPTAAPPGRGRTVPAESAEGGA